MTPSVSPSNKRKPPNLEPYVLITSQTPPWALEVWGNLSNEDLVGALETGIS